MKRVLIFSLAYLPHVGGAEIAIKELTDRVSPGDFEFHMIANRYDARLPHIEKVGNVLVHRIGLVTAHPTMADLRRFPLHLNKGLYQFLAALYAIRLHLKYRYDGVWAMMAHATGVPVALFNVFFPRVPFLLTLQEGDPPEAIERTMRPLWPLFVRAFKKAALVQSLSTFLEAWSVRRGASRTIVVPNGVDLRRFSSPTPGERRTVLREKFGLTAEDVLLVTLSRLVPKNGVDTVIDALGKLPSHVHFLVLGDGPSRAALMSQVKERGLDTRVHFYGEASQQEIPELLGASDIFVRVSRSEGQGIAFIEAMAAGLPTIGTNVGGIPDFLKDGETGFLIQPNDPESVRKAVEGVTHDMSRARAIAERGQNLVRTQYTWDIIAVTFKEKCLSVFV